MVIPAGITGIDQEKETGIKVTDEVKITSACCPEQMDKEGGVGITSGRGVTLTRNSLDCPAHPLSTGVV